MPESAGLRRPSAGRAQRRTLIVLVSTQAAAGVGVAAGIAVSNLVAAALAALFVFATLVHARRWAAS
ncbi:MAG: hypothetical protein ACRDUV_19405 [Pseudonocardiaceae bacterium]